MKQPKQLIFVRGLPGSGKSTIADKFKEQYSNSCSVCSTDEYWERPDGTYDFNYELLGKSHVWNQQRTTKTIVWEAGLTQWTSVVIVDNTNITFNEMKPYIRVGLQYGFEIIFIEPDTEWRYDVEECFKRNTHGVPYSTMLNMNWRWEDHETVTKKLKELEG